MVSVKRGGRWFKVSPGTSVGRVSVPGKSSSTPTPKPSSQGKTVPHDFVGPLQPGVTRQPAPKVYSGPVQSGGDTETFRKTGRSSGGKIAPKVYAGPVQQGVDVETFRKTGKTTGAPKRIKSTAPSKTVPHDFVGPLQRGVTRETVPASQREIYSRSSGAFLQPTYGIGAGGTATYRLPTIDEKSAIESARYRGSIPGIIEGSSYWVDTKFEQAEGIPIIKKVREKIKKAREEKDIFQPTITTGPTDAISQESFLSPSGVKKIFDIGAEWTLKTGELVGSQAVKSGVIKDPVLIGPSPISREAAKEIISGAYIFGAGSTLMRTGAEALKAQEFAKYKEFKKILEKPIRKEVVIEPEYFKISSKQGRFATETQKKIIDSKRLIKVKSQPKGEVSVIQSRPTGKWFGKVEETMQSGIFKRTKTFKGEAGIDKGIYKETIQYPRGIKKITTAPEFGPGEISIYKKGKLKYSLETKPPISPQLKIKKIKAEKIFEKPFGKGGVYERRSVFGEGGIKLTQPEKDVSTGLFKQQRKGTVELGRDIKTGVTRKVERIDDILDITRAGPRKTIKSIKGDGLGVTYKKDIGQKIVYSKAKEAKQFDYSTFIKTPGKQRLQKLKSPKIDRTIIQEEQMRVTTLFEDPSRVIRTKTKISQTPMKIDTKIPKKQFKDIVSELPGGSGTKLIQKSKEKISEVFTIQKPQSFLKRSRVKSQDVPIIRQTARPLESKLISRTATMVIPKAAFRTKQVSKTESITKQVSKQSSITEQVSKQSSIFSPAAVKSVTPTRALSRPLTGGGFRSPARITPKAKIPFTLGMGKSLPIAGKSQGYIPQAKSQGGKWVNLSRKPMSRESALSRGSRATDQTLSAQFRAKKSKGKVTNGIDNYFPATQQKYRPYKISKGKKVALQNHFIEKKGSRIDTRGEKQGLKLSKYVKQQGWSTSAKKKQKKSPWLF